MRHNKVNKMKFVVIFGVFAVAWLIIAGPADAGVSPRPLIVAPDSPVVPSQSQAGGTKIRKECEAKG